LAGETVLVIDDSPTILKVVQLVLAKAGFHVLTAADGEAGLEAAREQRPEVILLDFVMPKMNGYQVCRALTSDASLKDVPVVLMSAKGDQVGERFVKVMGIVDYITKPFSPEAITAVVQHTINKYGRKLERTPDHSGPKPKVDLSDETFQEGSPPPLMDGEPALTGDMRVIPLAEVLQLLSAQAQSGILSVQRGTSRVDVCFRQGKVDQALPQGLAEEFQIGAYVVTLQLMGQAELDSFIANRPAVPTGVRPIGQALMKAGYLSEPELKQAISKQTCELIYEVLRWNFGRFNFRATRDLPPSAVEANLGLDIDAILMEGFRRVDEWHLIEREIENFDQVFLRNEDAVAQMGRGRLTREELAVLELVNGKNTVKEIIRQSRMTSFEVSKMLYRLLSIKLLRRRVLPVAV
jgi:CheY-like chemotaxis protein